MSQSAVEVKPEAQTIILQPSKTKGFKKNKIKFIQNTEIGGSAGKIGLSDSFIADLFASKKGNLFEQTPVVIPNQALGAWLKDRITTDKNICANVNFIQLLGPVIQQIYLSNNPNSEIFDFSQAKFIIYAILCKHRFGSADSSEIINYLYADGIVDKFKAFQLASQLQGIFHEYLYLRTSELSKLKPAYFKEWQKEIWCELLHNIGEQKTFVDIYRYFIELDDEDQKLILPPRLFIFGLSSIYPSQLEILQKLSIRLKIYWYYQPCSDAYYGDLLSVKARENIKNKLLRKPDLSIEDLYLAPNNIDRQILFPQ